MDKELFRNGSGYADITAYKTMMNIERRIGNIMEFCRGEIFEYEHISTSAIKKALVVAADFRKNDRYISVILLTEEPKGKINIPIVCEGMMYADCGMVSFATNDRLGNYIRTATAEEMAQIDEGIAKCLGIEQKTVEVPAEKIVQVPAERTGFEEFKEIYLKTSEKVQQMEEIATAKAEANVYKNLYEKLLAKVMG